VNAKRILAALNEDFSDENVATAIDWLKTQNPTSKNTDKVLSKIFAHPRVQNDLEWLSQWAATNSWVFIFENFRDSNRVTLRQFEWAFKLLVANPGNPAAGSLWIDFLTNFRYEGMIENAGIWLRQCKIHDYEAQMVLSSLLGITQDKETIALAKKSLELRFNLFLLCALIEYTSDRAAISIAKEKLVSNIQIWEKQMIVEAMVNADLELNKESIYAFLNDELNRKRAFDVLHQIGIKSSNSLSFVCDWAEEHFSSRFAKEFYKKTRMFFVNDDAADKLWIWLKSRKITEIRFEIFIRLFETSWCALPNESRVLVQEWLESHPKHRLRSRVIKAYERVELKTRITTSEAKPTRVAISGHSTGATLSAQTAKFIGIEHMDFDDEWLQIARYWLDSAPKRHGATIVATEIYQITKKAEDLNRMKAALEGADAISIAVSIAEIRDFSDPDLIAMALGVIKTKRLFRNWRPDYCEIGKVVLALIQKLPDNKEVKIAAYEWTKIPPTRSGKQVHTDICKLLN
jgi:hypothetical protein